MTQDPDGIDPDDPPAGGPADQSSGGARKLDEDAAWRSIVENYGERAALDDEPSSSAEPTPSTELPASAVPIESPRSRDPLETEATWADEGHFIPPEPPPLPPLEPRRKLAWAGLFGSPVLMLVAVVFGWSYPGWLMGTLVVGFVGGFAYLVATMPQGRPDGWSGDDGAVV